MAEIDEATDRVLMGPAKVTKKYNDKELTIEVGNRIDTVTAPDFENENEL